MTFETVLSTLYSVGRVWLFEHGLALVFIIGLALGAQYAARYVVRKLINRLVRQGRASEVAKTKRENTLVRVVSGSLGILIWITAGLMFLSEVGVAIGPLLAAAGVAGIAIGFGGQYLIRDLISGLFIILENQYRTGDVVCFGETCGLVEDLTLRMTTLRDLDGTVHHVPHGEVTKVANLSKYYSRVNLNIGVSYNADLEHVIAVVNRVGQELADDPAWKEMVITAPQFLRVDDFADSAVVIKILGDTQPIKQWDVAGELRKRLKIAFDKEGIEIPFPQRVVTMRSGA